MVIEEYQQAKYVYFLISYFDTSLENFIRL